MSGRTITDKIADTRRAFEVFREELTPPIQRETLTKMTGPDALAAIAATGSIEAYEKMVQSSLSLARLIAANDRAALLAAAMVTQSGVARPVIEMEAGE